MVNTGNHTFLCISYMESMGVTYQPTGTKSRLILSITKHGPDGGSMNRRVSGVCFAPFSGTLLFKKNIRKFMNSERKVSRWHSFPEGIFVNIYFP